LWLLPYPASMLDGQYYNCTGHDVLAGKQYSYIAVL
jgi:hypothetical protein